MMSRPFPIRVAQVALFLFTTSAMIQTARSFSFPWVWHMYWALPASLGLIGGAVLAGIHQERAVARPLAMAVFGVIAVRGTVALVDQGFPDLAYSFPEVLAIVMVVGALGLAAWFGLSGAAERDLART